MTAPISTCAFKLLRLAPAAKKRTGVRGSAVIAMMTCQIVPIVSLDQGRFAGAVGDDRDRIAGQERDRQTATAGIVDRTCHCEPRIFHDGQSRLECQEAEKLAVQSGPPMPGSWQHPEAGFEQTVLNLRQTLWVNGCFRKTGS